jgi:hydroxysqualene dehydroxylase
MSAARPRVAVVGGGWAGFSAAVALCDAGAAVMLFEQARVPGGRARRIDVHGRVLDNGQHLLLGAFRATAALLSRLGVPLDQHCARLPLTMRPFGNVADIPAIVAPRWPAPFHLLHALAFARGLGVAERLGLITDFRRLARAEFRCPTAMTVTECFERSPPRAFAAVWAPLCVAALNTPPSRASAQVFANVLRAAFTGSAASSDMLVPGVDLSALMPDAAARHLATRGSTVCLGRRVRAMTVDDSCVHVDRVSEPFDGVVVAVGPHQLAAVEVAGAAAPAWHGVREAAATLSYESIATVYLAYAAAALETKLMRLDDAPGQWVFDRGTGAQENSHRVLGVVVSGNGPHDAWDHATLARRVDAQLRSLRTALPAPAWSQVIVERRATYACTPGRPRFAARVAPRLALAGDYCDAEFPATLEAAVRSGAEAARVMLDELAWADSRPVESARLRA